MLFVDVVVVVVGRVVGVVGYYCCCCYYCFPAKAFSRRYRCSHLFSDPLRFSTSFAYFNISGGNPFTPTRIKKFSQAMSVAVNKCHADDGVDCRRQVKH